MEVMVAVARDVVVAVTKVAVEIDVADDAAVTVAAVVVVFADATTAVAMVVLPLTLITGG